MTIESEAPYAETGLYFEDIPEKKAFVKVLKALTKLGFQFTDRGYVHKGTGIGERPFAYINDEQRFKIPLNSWEDTDSLLANPDVRLVQVVMKDVANDTEVMVGYLSISPEAVGADWHPIVIWSNGALFEGPLTALERKEKRAKKKGKQLYRLLKDLVNKLHPSYATLTVAAPIECPTDLARDPRSYAFYDFYISESFLGPADYGQVKEMFKDAYVEPVGDGVYISCYKHFNPQGQACDNKLDKSCEVAKLIANRARK